MLACHPRSPASFPLIRTVWDCRLWRCKSITCKCRQVYIGQPSRSTETMVKEHHQRICLALSDNLTLAEHSFIQQQHVQLWDTEVLSTKSHCNREATEIELHPKDRNSEDGPIVSSYAHLSITPSESTALHKMDEMLVALFSITTPKFPSSPGMTELHLQWPLSCTLDT